MIIVHVFGQITAIYHLFWRVEYLHPLLERILYPESLIYQTKGTDFQSVRQGVNRSLTAGNGGPLTRISDR
jgi:hypothetical protein